MKLKDFVFNSLRVRGKKKKKAPPGTAGVTDISTGCFGLDKNRNWFPSSTSRGRSQGGTFKGDDLIDANWQGNALYKGLVITEEARDNCALIGLDNSSCSSIKFSQSEMAASSSFTEFDKTLDDNFSRDTASENFGSYSSMSPLFEADTESSIHSQYYSYHYHHERHNPQSEHRLHSQNQATLLQQHNHSIDNVHHLGFKNSQTSQKPETGFFRKSLASLKNIRKDSSKTKPQCSKQTGHARVECAMGFLPEETTPVNKVSVNKTSAKLKKRGSKLFSKSKENRDLQFSAEDFENQWTLESRIKDDLTSAKVTMDPFISTCTLYDRPYVRECSIESCPPRHYSFQEEFSMREFDLTGFESASFSGYESDISRSRGRKARSRIKTNPWLPSPQFTHSVASRWEEWKLREASENIQLLEGEWGFPQPDSLEYHESGLQPFQSYPTSDSRRYHRKHSTRKSPTGIRMALNVNACSPYSVTKRSLDQQYNCVASCKITSPRTSSLNDLSNNAMTIREASPFSSPNTEFSMLAENLEQLATNISFEYEDTFDATMESVSAGKETCPSFSHEMFTDDENSQIPQQEESHENRLQMTYSPDSGVGGLGYSEVDNNMTPTAQREANETAIACLMSSTLLGTACTILKEIPDDNCTSEKGKEPRAKSSRDALKSQYSSSLNICNFSSLSNPWEMSGQIVAPRLKSNHEDTCFVGENCVSAVTESDTNVRHQDTHMTATCDSDGHPLFTEKTYAFIDSKASHLESRRLMKEEFCTTKIHTQDPKVYRSSKLVGTEVSSHIEMIDAPPLVMHSSECTPALDKAVVKKSRPNVLNAKPRMFLNNMEKTSGYREQQRSWMDEFDFPRNITASESIESPTENWQWDYQFAMYHSLDAGSPRKQLYRVAFDEGGDRVGAMLENASGNMQIEELVVRLEDTDCQINAHQETNEATSAKNCLDTSNFQTSNSQTGNSERSNSERSNSEKLENGTVDDNFEMNDACVQTDFDDDFDTLNDEDNAEYLEEGMYDLSEGRHVWLSTENVVLDSWTGCKIQARDSEIMRDELVAIRSDEGDEQGSPDNVCGAEPSSHSQLRHLAELSSHSQLRHLAEPSSHSQLRHLAEPSSHSQLRHLAEPSSHSQLHHLAEPSSHSQLRHLEWKTCVNSQTHSRAVVSEDLQVKSHDTAHRQLEPIVRDDSMKQLSSDAQLMTVGKRPDLQSTQKPRIHSIKTTPETTVHIPFLDIEKQFRNICNQTYEGCESQRNTERSKLTLQSSETIVELSDSDCSHSEAVHRKGFQCQRNRGSKLNYEGKSLITNDNVQYSDRNPGSTPPSNTLVNYFQSNRRMLKLEKMAELSHVDANGNFLYNRSRLKRPCESLQRFSTPRQDNFDDFLITPLNANKAAYLTFQADSPLCGSLVERPLCLVPDANPLSRLHFEQMKGISLNPACDDEGRTAWVSSISSPFFTSLSVTNCKDIHQYKKTNQTLLQSKETAIDLLPPDTLKSSLSPAQYPALNDQLDTAQLSSSLNETSSEKSEIVSNSVYSFAKAPSYVQQQDYTRTSDLETLSYSTAALANRSSKSRFSPMSSGFPPTHDRKCLAEKVMSLCQEKDLIFQKIYEAKQEEVCRKEHRLQIQRRMQAQTREALLQPLIELRNKLEEQSRRLNEKCNVNGSSNSPFRFL